MMLADSCEAAARSLARPDPENIRSIVVKIVDAIVSDGQLDDCDLTLQELTTIREAIISALTAIYHARIDYPGFTGEDTLETITWEEFFAAFEENNLAFLYQDETKDGGESRFSKLIDRDSSEKAKAARS